MNTGIAMKKVMEVVGASCEVNGLEFKNDEQLRKEVIRGLRYEIANHVLNDYELPIEYEKHTNAFLDTVRIEMRMCLIERELHDQLRFIGGHKFLKLIEGVDIHKLLKWLGENQEYRNCYHKEKK